MGDATWRAEAMMRWSPLSAPVGEANSAYGIGRTTNINARASRQRRVVSHEIRSVPRVPVVQRSIDTGTCSLQMFLVRLAR